MGRKSSIAEWGPAAWKFMHVVSFTYPNAPNDEQRSNAFNFLKSVSQMLPCKRCREEWTEYISKHLSHPDSDHLESKASFSRFLVDGHNFVNRRLQKREVSYEEARELFDPETPTHKAASLAHCAVVVAVTAAALGFVLLRSLLHDHKRSTTRVSPGFNPPSRRTFGLRM